MDIDRRGSSTEKKDARTSAARKPNKPSPKTARKQPAAKPGNPGAAAAGRRQARAGKAVKQPGAPAGLSKAAFVRNQPLHVSAKEVLAAAARLGMTMSADYIHKVRSTAKAKAEATGSRPVLPARTGAGRRARKQAPRPAAPRPLGLIRAGTPDASFRKLVLELGLQRAKFLLSEVERKLNALIGGS